VIEESVKKLARGANFGTITTLDSQGSPMTHVMWVDCDDEHMLINTETHRTKFRNVQRDPRVTVTVWDNDDPYTYVEVRGRVTETVTGPEARRHIDDLSMKYRGELYDERIIKSERVILKITPERQRG
jgi:PPOX class probable F420-dependent enzyme